MRISSIASILLSFLLPFSTFAVGIQGSSTASGDWGSGFCQKISLANTESTSQSWSEIRFTLKNAKITNSWNGVFTSANDVYTIKPVAWNNPIAAGQSIDIGYCGEGSGRPIDIDVVGGSSSTNPTTPPVIRPAPVHLVKDALTLDATVNDWQTGYCRTITLKNTGTAALSNWKFAFDSTATMNLWSGKVTKAGNTVTVTPEAWNGSITPNGVVELGFCADGTTSDSNWNLLGSDSGPIIPTPTPTNGSCGADNGKALSNTPVNLCSAGSATNVSGNGPWAWSCLGQNGGSNASCSATKSVTPPNPVNGSCGSDNGKTLDTPPTALCIAGTASNVSGNGPWSWSCNGQNGGSSATCAANKSQVTPPNNSGALIYTIDANKNRSAISPYIYGRNFGDGNTENFDAMRLGGNRLTGYNWENNASNAGSDWNHSSDSYLGDSNVPGKTVTDFHDKNRSLGVAYSLVTMPMAGYVARDKNGTVNQNETAPSNRWDDVVVAKNSAFSLTPNLTDGHVYSDEFINFLVNKYGKANTATGIKGYALDNEPALWTSTHSRLHPNKVTVSEMITRSTALSKAIKAVDATAEIFGAVTYGFGEHYNLQDAPDWSNYSSTYATYIDAFLANLKSASDTQGKRLLDVLDIHWYPEAQGTTLAGNKVRILENNSDPDVARARMQAPRSLWDPTYREDSWIGQWYASTAFPLIPKLKASIDRYYPGTKLAITEFDYGGNNHISGGIATADVLGIYGKYGVYFSSYWGNVDGYVSSAYKLYRNVDGANTTFGDTEIDATNPDIENTSIYASTEGAGGKAHVILINKKNTPVNIHLNLANITANKADVYGFDATNTAITKRASVNVGANGLDYTLPALTAVHLIFAGTSTTVAPTTIAPKVTTTTVPVTQTTKTVTPAAVITPAVTTVKKPVKKVIIKKPKVVKP